MQTLSVGIDGIQIGERHRALSDDAVSRLASSIRDVGLRQPITIRVADLMIIDGDEVEGVPVLVTGAHRLAAAKSLGWSHIECIEIDDDIIKAEMWEIAENLHRLDLTKEQRDEHIRRYAELLEARLQSGQTVPVESKREDGRGHRVKGVAAQIADETGLSAKTIRRALNPKPPAEVIPIAARSQEDVILAQANAIIAAWNRASPEARSIAMDQMDGGPVFDRTQAAR